PDVPPPVVERLKIEDGAGDVEETRGTDSIIDAQVERAAVQRNHAAGRRNAEDTCGGGFGQGDAPGGVEVRDRRHIDVQVDAAARGAGQGVAGHVDGGAVAIRDGVAGAHLDRPAVGTDAADGVHGSDRDGVRVGE